MCTFTWKQEGPFTSQVTADTQETPGLWVKATPHATTFLLLRNTV